MAGKIFSPDQVSLNVTTVSTTCLQDIETNILAHLVLTYRYFSILLLGEAYFILPRQAMVAYHGASQAHCETIFELRLCKAYHLNGTNLPNYTDNVNQVNIIRTGLGFTTDRHTRIINLNGRIMALSHPAGITHPGSNATRPPNQLQHSLLFWLLRGVQPNLSPQQIIHAIRTHDQQQMDEAVAVGARPPPPLGLAIHLVVCNSWRNINVPAPRTHGTYIHLLGPRYRISTSLRH